MQRKKILKDIYIMRFNKFIPKEKIAIYIKNKYHFNKSIQSIARKISSIFPLKKHWNSWDFKLSIFEINFLKRACSKFANKYKVLNYFNLHFNKQLSYQRLIALMRKCKIKIKKHPSKLKCTLEQENQVLKLYSKNKNMLYISKKLKINRSTVRKILERHNIKIKTKEDFVDYHDLSFEKIDSPEKAYFLGLLQTDGCNLNHCRVGIQLIDKDCIDFLSKSFNLNVVAKEAKNKNCHKAYSVSFGGKKRISQIEKLGIVPQKTYTLKPPPMDLICSEYLRFIVRGIIDGDGWIEKHGRGFFICSASKDFVNWCKKILEDNFHMINLHLKFRPNKGHGIYLLSSSLISNMNILKDIYKEPFGMMRKFNRVHYSD